MLGSNGVGSHTAMAMAAANVVGGGGGGGGGGIGAGSTGGSGGSNNSGGGSNTNGASLEDCHANVFALTDICGIRWCVFRDRRFRRQQQQSEHQQRGSVHSDPLLNSYARLVQSNVLAVWRRSSSMLGEECHGTKGGSSDVLGHWKELWVFWYGDRPDDTFDRVIDTNLEEEELKAGSWENGLPYEARNLLFKALNNLIERSLLRHGFVRLGRWFVQPLEGNSSHGNTANCHLSFGFDYFIHGESTVCACVDVRQHPPVRRLSLHHLNHVRLETPSELPVILGPFGMAAMLTGTSYSRGHPVVKQTLMEWKLFYPIDHNDYYCQNSQGDVLQMPEVVEVNVAGVKLVYPSSYVLVTELDAEVHQLQNVSGQIPIESSSPTISAMDVTFNNFETSHQGVVRPSLCSISRTFEDRSVASLYKRDIFDSGPSPFTSSDSPYFSLHSIGVDDSPSVRSSSVSLLRTEYTWQDAIIGHSNSNGESEGHHHHYEGWNFANPRQVQKRRSKNRVSLSSGSGSASRSREHRSRFSSRVSNHKRKVIVDAVSWSLDHLSSEPQGVTSHISNSLQPLGSVKGGSLMHLPSPASVVNMSAATPKGQQSVSFSPLCSNGPHTPSMTPRTPKSVPAYTSAPSPFVNVKSVEKRTNHTESQPNDHTTQSSIPQPMTTTSNFKSVETMKSTIDVSNSDNGESKRHQNIAARSGCEASNVIVSGGQVPKRFQPRDGSFRKSCRKRVRRPRLPIKDYEESKLKLMNGSSGDDKLVSDAVYDNVEMQHWLNHPVKKYCVKMQNEDDPLRPLYRRNSNDGLSTGNHTNHTLFPDGSDKINQQQLSMSEYKSESNTDETVVMTQSTLKSDIYDFNNTDHITQDTNCRRNDVATNKVKTEEDKTDLFTSDGLKATMADLDNLFDESNDDDEDVVVAPTPPLSNKSVVHAEDETNNHIGHDFVKNLPTSSMNSLSKLSAVTTNSVAASSCQVTKALFDPLGNLPHDQLSKMFPTPPSHEHIQMTSPAEIIVEIDHHQQQMECGSNVENSDYIIDMNNFCVEDSSFIIFGPEAYAPLERLYSDDFSNDQSLCRRARYEPKHHVSSARRDLRNVKRGARACAVPGVVSRLNTKSGLSPASPLICDSNNGGPHSHHGNPGSNSFQHCHDVSSPASVSSNSNLLNSSLRSNAVTNKSENGLKGNSISRKYSSSVLLNLYLSDSVLNAHLDHNFDSCTLCICSNEGNIRGRDGPMYLPQNSQPTSNLDDLPICSCGFSAIVNRRLAHQSGLFYEDEAEVTSITEDLYFRKKPSLLLLDPKYGESQDLNFNERSAEVDIVSNSLLEIIHQLSSLALTSDFNAVSTFAAQVANSEASMGRTQISMLQLMDANELIFVGLEDLEQHEKNASNLTNASSNGGTSSEISQKVKLDESLKGTCLHKWTLLPSPGPSQNEDIVRVMKNLQPLINETLHESKLSSVARLSVQGPLTWRQFHQMAGPATKGNTDDQCEPLPVPSIVVGHDKEALSISPLAMHFWQTLNLEPVSKQRDVLYFVVAPENNVIVENVRSFFNDLSKCYTSCKFGRHVPHTEKGKLRDGIIRVGKSKVANLANEDMDKWFDLIGDYPTAALLKLYAQVCHFYLRPLLMKLKLGPHLMEESRRPAPVERPPPSPLTSMLMSVHSGGSNPSINQFNAFEEPLSSRPTSYRDDFFASQENERLKSDEAANKGGSNGSPAVVIYIVDGFSMSSPPHTNLDFLRLTTLGLLRIFDRLTSSLNNESLQHNVHLQLVSLERIFQLQRENDAYMKGFAFSVYSQVERTMQYEKLCKSLTGFGPASASERFLKTEKREEFVRSLYQPVSVLAPTTTKKPTTMTTPGTISTMTSTNTNDELHCVVLFVNYCLSSDQHWLLATCSDDRGELLKSVVINIEIPNKTRRKKASARRVGLKKLMDWILSVMALTLAPWRLVIGRIGRIGHGELRGWSVLLGRKSLRRASKHLRDICTWPSDVPTLLSACLVSLEANSTLRLMSDQFTPDERFGQHASRCQLSTPKDVSATHILVYPVSATAQSSQKAFEDHQEGIGSAANDLNDFGLPDMDLDIEGQEDDLMGFKDIFSDENWGNTDHPGSPTSPKRSSTSQPNSPLGAMGGNGGGPTSGHPMDSGSFRYGQEEQGERIEILQQPLALGLMVSTAPTGPMPRWFWASCPHMEHMCPVCLKSSLHINQASLANAVDDAFATQTNTTTRVHSLDSTYTSDVLRYVLEGYNALSWLSIDPVTNDRRSCLPIHVQVLQEMYASLSALL